MESLPKGGRKSAIFIIFVEVGERFAYYGVSGNLITYLTNVLGQPTAMAAKNVNIWQGVSAIFPLLGAFFADSYLGRFKTILISSIIYLMGLVLLTMSVSAIPLQHRGAAFFVALYVLTVGEGGHKPCVQTFAADQFEEELPEEKAAKSSFFNWWYLGIVSGATMAILVVIYVQDYVGWDVGFGMLAVAVAVALALFLIGSTTYKRQAPIGSPFTRVSQVLVAAARKRRQVSVSQRFMFRFLDNAMIIDEIDASSKTRNPWRLCSVNQVEEVKLLLRLLPIWLCCLMFTLVNAQLSTYFTKQGSTMIRSIGSNFHIPAASFQVFTGLTILTAVAIYDQLLVPIAKNITGHPSGITMLQRMGTGIFFSILTMVVAALVEAKRVSIARHHGLIDAPKSTVPLIVWWLLPQYILCGLSDVFTIVGMQELFYDQMPDEMRSMGAAAYISTVGVGSFMSSAVISVVQAISSRCGNEWLGDNLNRAHLDYFYWVLAGLSALNLCIYLLVAKGFVYKKIEWDDPTEEKELAFHA
ncbi:hypothetical protein F0562_013364 [Nyssa sinensis]|uniref:Major facilitator superfamily (MFS) profile domain-containing protein n=1 Tax=Nyssa sinensis TaxID=561372 RepID=A0A5J4ZN87_9ASTE|nr:hypothetical protein F0562_013364 [Nyssa sinensis]